MTTVKLVTKSYIFQLTGRVGVYNAGTWVVAGQVLAQHGDDDRHTLPEDRFTVVLADAFRPIDNGTTLTTKDQHLLKIQIEQAALLNLHRNIAAPHRGVVSNLPGFPDPATI